MANFDDTSYELLSAYLDGELQADEQARVESLLEESAEHRGLFEDLQSLRSRFEELPAQNAPPSLNLRIMDAIGEAEPDWAATPQSETDKPTETVTTAPRQRSVWKSGLVRIAIAASLLLGAVLGYRTLNPPPRDEEIAGSNPEQSIDDQKPPEQLPENAIAQGPDQPAVDESQAPPEPQPTSFVFQNVKSSVMMIVYCEVDPRLIENDTFKNTLKMHDIDLNDTIRPDLAAQKSILESAAFGVADKAKRGAEGQVQFSIVTAHIDKLTIIQESLSAVQGVKSTLFDLSVNPKDMQMMHDLDKARGDQFATVRVEENKAYFVSLTVELQKALLGRSAAVMSLSGGLPGGLPMPNLGGPAPFDADGRIMPAIFILKAVKPAK